MSRLELMVEPKAEPVRRIEVITGADRRRSWTADEKAKIIEETLTPDAVVSEIARRHGLTPQQLFTWRRGARRKEPAASSRASAAFVPAVIFEPASALPARAPRARREVSAAGMIEVLVAGATLRIGKDVDTETLTAVIRALKAAR